MGLNQSKVQCVNRNDKNTYFLSQTDMESAFGKDDFTIEKKSPIRKNKMRNRKVKRTVIREIEEDESLFRNIFKSLKISNRISVE